MAYIRLPAGIKVAMEYDWNGKAVVNVYHVTTNDPITTVKLEAIANVFRVSFWTALKGYLSTQISLTGVTALNLDVPNGERVSVAQTPASPGLYTGDSVSNNVASVVTFKTALTGRSYQGRSYIPGIPEAEVSQNDLGTTITAGFASSFATLLAALLLENSNLVVASFQTANLPRSQGIATVIDSIFANARVDTQRRRLPKA